MGQVEWLAAKAAKFPSAPVWHPAEQRLYWSDIQDCRLFRTDPISGETETILDDGHPVGAMILQADGSLLLFRDQGSIVSFRDGNIGDTAVAASQDLKHTRFSCAAAAPDGGVVCAVLSDFRHPARIFHLDRKGHLSPLFETVGVPAGLAFVESGAEFLLSNSYATRANVIKFRFDAATGTPLPAESSVFLDCHMDNTKTRGTPAGLAVASDGSILVTRMDGSAISRHSPDGGRLGSFSIHIRRPVGLCFGGDGLRDLLVTTAGAHRMVIDGAHAGEIAVIRDFKPAGAPVFVSRIGLPDEEPAAATAAN